jgi:opacity protein-like surface antigen
MKPAALLSASVLSLVAGAALAADLPSLKAPPVPPPPPPMWTGFYAGLSAGDAWENNDPSYYATYPTISSKYLFLANANPSLNTAEILRRTAFWTNQNGAIPGSSNGGFIGGAQIGYNWQLGWLGGAVAGVEADVQGFAFRNGYYTTAGLYNTIRVPGDTLLNSATGSSSLVYLGTIRGRLGYLVAPTLLVYGAGGFAFGGAGFRAGTSSFYSNAGHPAATPPKVEVQNAFGNINSLSILTGWTVGGGFEWMFLPRWSLKAEYLYYALGNGGPHIMAAQAYPIGVANAFGGSEGGPAEWTLTNFSSPRVSGSIARVGVNYHFESAVPAGHAHGDGSGGMHGGAMHEGEMKGKGHTVVPAGVHGAHMVGAGVVRFNYLPSYAVMRGNYVGTSQIAPAQVTTIPWFPNSVYALQNFLLGNPSPTRTLRNAPDNMKMQMHMFSMHYGVTDWLNLMVMGSVSDRNMSMWVFNGPSGATPLGPTSSATQGWGDTSVQGLIRLYQDDIHHVHANLGLSLPTGSIDQQIIHLHPSALYFSKRAYFGLQLGTGTYDSLFGLTYTGKLNAWSWGLTYRGRVALGVNDAGYLRGPWNEINAWGGYEVLPGLSATGRVAATIWDRIRGQDYQIAGAQQGTIPDYQGGERVRLLGGLDYHVAFPGFKPIRIAVEAGAPVYQRLNGPQLGESWELNTALGFGF